MARPISSDVRLSGNDKFIIEKALILYRLRFEDYEKYPERNEIGQQKREVFDEINRIRGKVMEL
jgi:hypothetical protein